MKTKPRKSRSKSGRAHYAAGLFDELVVDNFAGGGGASIGIEQALGRAVDVAINHDREAVALHAANHPHTLHHCEDVWDVDPIEATSGRPVGLAWFSPDCKHFSRAKGNKPVEKKIRGLAWVVVKWAKKVRPRVIMLENVREFETWGPLVEAKTKGGIVIVDRFGKPKMVPCPIRKGQTFRQWISSLRKLGYEVEWRSLNAADFGAPTHRRRLFLIARNDGRPIVWPTPTHGPGRPKPWRAAAECIDWSIPCPSIFLTRAEARPLGIIRPLADKTMRRIAMGLKRFVFDRPDPFLVRVGDGVVAPYITRIGQAGGNGGYVNEIGAPLTTVVSKAEHLLLAPSLVRYNTEKSGNDVHSLGLDEPVGVVTAENRFALVAAFLSKYFGGVVGSAMDEPLHTITAIDHNALVAPVLVKNNHGDKQWCDPREPLRTIVAGGQHHGVAAAHLQKFYGKGHLHDATGPAPTLTGENHTAVVAAYLAKYYGTATGQDLGDPLHTITAVDRFGLVTVDGEPWAVADIGLRMLSPRELYRCQGFPEDYRIDVPHEGKRLTKSAQVRMVGNSVSPVMSRALVEANMGDAFGFAEDVAS